MAMYIKAPNTASKFEFNSLKLKLLHTLLQTATRNYMKLITTNNFNRFHRELHSSVDSPPAHQAENYDRCMPP